LGGRDQKKNLGSQKPPFSPTLGGLRPPDPQILHFRPGSGLLAAFGSPLWTYFSGCVTKPFVTGQCFLGTRSRGAPRPSSTLAGALRAALLVLAQRANTMLRFSSVFLAHCILRRVECAGKERTSLPCGSAHRKPTPCAGGCNPHNPGIAVRPRCNTPPRTRSRRPAVRGLRPQPTGDKGNAPPCLSANLSWAKKKPTKIWHF